MTSTGSPGEPSGSRPLVLAGRVPTCLAEQVSRAMVCPGQQLRRVAFGEREHLIIAANAVLAANRLASGRLQANLVHVRTTRVSTIRTVSVHTGKGIPGRCRPLTSGSRTTVRRRATRRGLWLLSNRHEGAQRCSYTMLSRSRWETPYSVAPSKWIAARRASDTPVGWSCSSARWSILGHPPAPRIAAIAATHWKLNK